MTRRFWALCCVAGILGYCVMVMATIWFILNLFIIWALIPAAASVASLVLLVFASKVLHEMDHQEWDW